jgi:hypothetical protein
MLVVSCLSLCFSLRNAGFPPFSQFKCLNLLNAKLKSDLSEASYGDLTLSDFFFIHYFIEQTFIKLFMSLAH